MKVKQSRYRPGVAQRVPGSLKFPDFMTTAQDGGKIVSLRHRSPLLTPCSRVLLEKRTGSEVSQEIPRIFGTRRFLTLPTSARHMSLT